MLKLYESLYFIKSGILQFVHHIQQVGFELFGIGIGIAWLGFDGAVPLLNLMLY